MFLVISESQELTNSWENLGGKITITSYQKFSAHLKINLKSSSDIRMRAFIYFEEDGTPFPLTKEVLGRSNSIEIEEKRLNEFSEFGTTTAEFAIPDGAIFLQLQIKAGIIGAIPGEVLEVVGARCYNANTIGTKPIGDVAIANSVGELADVEQLIGTSHNIDDKRGIVAVSGLYIRVSDNILIPANGDKATSDLVSISHPHHEIHEGNYYSFCHYNESLANAGTIQFIITSPDTENFNHFRFSFSSTLKIKFELFENTTHNLGASQTIINRNRNFNDTPDTLLNTSAGGGVDGNLIDCSSFGSPSVGVVGGGGGQSSQSVEWVLKPNTKYLLKLTSGSNDNNVSLNLNWYERKHNN